MKSLVAVLSHERSHALMPALSGHAAWCWCGMDGYHDSGSWRGSGQCAAVAAGRPAWLPRKNPGPSPAGAGLPGTGHCLGIRRVLVQPVVPSVVWELLSGDSLISGVEGAAVGVVRGDGPGPGPGPRAYGAWASGEEASCSSCLGGMFRAQCGQGCRNLVPPAARESSECCPGRLCQESEMWLPGWGGGVPPRPGCGAWLPCPQRPILATSPELSHCA